jgi:hypothetical protein
LSELREQCDFAFDNSSYWDWQIRTSDWNQGRRICLKSGDVKMVIIGNFKPGDAAVTTPNFPETGTWYDLMTDETIDVTDVNMTISLDAGKFKVLTNMELNIPSGINNVKKNDELSLEQTPEQLTVVTDEPVVSVKVYTVNGLLAKQVQGGNTVSIAGLPKGCYIVNVQLSGQSLSRKFVK